MPPKNSIIIQLLFRSEYFKTALKTSVGNNNKDLKVDECSPYVLATVVDFIYGIKLPEELSSMDANSLLAMADLYLMEDLKDAVGSLIISKHTDIGNILEVSQMAEEYRSQKLKELCCEFIFQNLQNLDKETLMELYKALPLLGEKAWLELVNKGRPQTNTDVLNRVLGINVTDPFKKTEDFQSDDDYKGYVMNHIKPNMLVRCNKSVNLKSLGSRIPEGAIGRVISCDLNGAKVKWLNTSLTPKLKFGNLDLLTPPVDAPFFDD